jgi:hypothetical protein
MQAPTATVIVMEMTTNQSLTIVLATQPVSYVRNVGRPDPSKAGARLAV